MDNNTFHNNQLIIFQTLIEARQLETCGLVQRRAIGLLD